LTPEETENLLQSDRRYNKYLYDNETDNYQQTHYQLLFSSALTNWLTLNTALHYTRGKGYYEQFRNQDEYTDYGLSPIEVNDGTIAETDLVRQRWLDNHFYGGTYSLVYKNQAGFELTWGGAYNRYEGGHYGDLVCRLLLEKKNEDRSDNMCAPAAAPRVLALLDFEVCGMHLAIDD